MKKINITVLFMFLLTSLSATNYFIAVNGSDSNTGTINSPFATIKKVQEVVAPGDTVFIRGGTYRIPADHIMSTRVNAYACVFDMAVSGTENNRICYWGYQNERPVFDLSAVKPANMRVAGFWVTGSWLHFKNFEVTGTQVTISDGSNTQSEAFTNRGGSNNIYEYLSVHDGMAIGFYITQGSNILFLNCDAYNNYDTVSDGGYGGNVDGFGGHPQSSAHSNIVFRGCRAWYNSDDGFDLINAWNPCIIDNCWSFYNGYRPNTFDPAGDGAGFKSGGYGMQDNPSVPAEIPMHIVQNCLAYYNSQQGFYANHHLGGIAFYNNTGYMNPSNFNMKCRKSVAEKVDVDGYGHIIKNNLSFEPRLSKHYSDLNTALCEISNNSFLPVEIKVNSTDFISLAESQLMSARKPDGSLPDITFLRLQTNSDLWTMRLGNYATHVNGEVNPYDWVQLPSIVVSGNTARVVGVGAEAFTQFYVEGKMVNFDSGSADLSSYSGTIELKATTSNGGVTKLKIKK